MVNAITTQHNLHFQVDISKIKYLHRYMPYWISIIYNYLVQKTATLTANCHTFGIDVFPFYKHKMAAHILWRRR